MRLVLLDTSALFASLDRNDPNHALARGFMESEDTSYLVTDTVFSEAMTLVKLHLRVELAVKTGRAILAGAPFRVQQLSAEQTALTWRFFCRYTDKAWSYTDCSLLAVARDLGIKHVFAFDRHFDQMSGLGLQRVP